MTLEQVIKAVRSLTPNEQHKIGEMFSRKKQQTRKTAAKRKAQSKGKAKPKRRDLYGAYRGLIPDNFNFDAALNEIRNDWKEELIQIVE